MADKLTQSHYPEGDQGVMITIRSGWWCVMCYVVPGHPPVLLRSWCRHPISSVPPSGQLPPRHCPGDTLSTYTIYTLSTLYSLSTLSLYTIYTIYTIYRIHYLHYPYTIYTLSFYFLHYLPFLHHLNNIYSLHCWWDSVHAVRRRLGISVHYASIMLF